MTTTDPTNEFTEAYHESLDERAVVVAGEYYDRYLAWMAPQHFAKADPQKLREAFAERFGPQLREEWPEEVPDEELAHRRVAHIYGFGFLDYLSKRVVA